MRFLLLLFIAMPILEMWLLIEIGSRIGTLATIALVFLTAAIGLALLRQQGMRTLLRVNQQMERGQLPAAEILGGVMLAVGGALLLTPGFITDAIGFACLLPPSRKAIVAILMRQGLVMARYGRGATFDHYSNSDFRPGQGQGIDLDQVDGGQSSAPKPPKATNIIDGDFRRED